MRTIKKWDEMKWRYLSKFPPRLQRDLKVIKPMITDNIKESTFIFGDVQTGKTVLAAQIMMLELRDIYLHSIPNAHNKTLFISFTDMLADIKRTYSSPENTDDILRKYQDAYFLVIDDFATTRPTDWMLEIIYQIINYRYEYLKKTIITCNKSLRELELFLQEQRITSRINRSYTIIEKQPY